MTGLFLGAAIYYARAKLRWFFIFILLGIMVYEIGVEKMNSTLALYTQWWKTTIWVEAFAMILISKKCENAFRRVRPLYRFGFIVPILILLACGVYRLSGWFSHATPYQFPWQKEISPEMDISLKAGQLTPDNALFVIPVGLTEFRWFSKRGTYIDWKPMLHQEKFLNEWYQRTNEIYHFGIPEQEAGFNLYHFSHYLLHEPSSMSVEYWKRKGITHIISTNPLLTELELVYSNPQLAIYKL
jgi:hypothetical protein